MNDKSEFDCTCGQPARTEADRCHECRAPICALHDEWGVDYATETLLCASCVKKLKASLQSEMESCGELAESLDLDGDKERLEYAQHALDEAVEAKERFDSN